MEGKAYINSNGVKVLEYESMDSFILRLPFILTESQRLQKNGLYMKLEKTSTTTQSSAIRLLDFQDYQNKIYLNVQDLQTQKCYNLSWNLNFDGHYWLWSLADLSTLSDLTK
jgi:hypothetical protein